MSSVTGFRISPQQASWWRNAQMSENSPSATWLQLEVLRPVVPGALQQRLTELSAREEILRTRLHRSAGMAQPLQIIAEQADIPLTIEDLQSLPQPEHAVRLEALLQKTITSGPLEVWLLQLSAERWSLTLRSTPGYLDLHSLVIIASELLADRPFAQSDEPTLQYADYAEWKHDVLTTEAEHPGLQFWQQHKQTVPDISLPGLQNRGRDKAGPAMAAGPVVVDVIKEHLHERANSLGIDVGDYLYASWSILLARLTGQTRVPLAWLDVGRGDGLDDALGPYEQTLPVLVDVDPARALPDQIRQLLQPLQLAQGWGDYYDSTSDSTFGFSYRELTSIAEQVHVMNAVTRDDACSLRLDCVAHGEALSCRLIYDSALFSAIAIECLAEQWQQLLRGLQEASIPVGRIALQHKRQAALLAPQSAAPAIEPVSVLKLIDRQGQSHPSSVALVDRNGTLTYQALLERSNQLARHLLDHGQTQGVVGILLERGTPMIIAMLGILRAGCAYLPLDPTYPADRLAYMIDDSEARTVITSASLTHLLPDSTTRLLLHNFLRDSLESSAGAPSDTLKTAAADLQQPAYLIYTSGSTGQPKAVEVSHANLSHSTQVRIAFYNEPIHSYLLLSSFAFDSSVAGIFWTLAQGGTLVLPASGEELDLARLAELIEQHRVSHSLSLPSLYETLLDYSTPEGLSSLSTWIVAGESCPSSVLAKHRHKVPQARLVNEYGPTEATVWATADVLSEQDDDSISIGRPIPTVDLWLLNDQGVPAGIGEPGQIVLGGPTLALGYRGRPEATAQAFVSSTDFAEGQRVYATGDLARWRLDGRLSFLGRVDHQVKIRGHRVELGEIERLLAGHSQVREAVVIARAHASGTQLVGYITAQAGPAPSVQALQAYLEEKLPAHMMPAALIPMKSLPRTPNGKLDVNALPEPDMTAATRSVHVAPRTALEITLATICAEVLRRESVSVMDNFFQIGGDSILSLQIVARAKQQNIRLSAKQVFEAETIAAMAAVAVLEAPAELTADRPSERFALANLDDQGLEDLLAELDAAQH
ncbi:MAG: non-ribosomal peptide synthetase [unclassified Hahellaceae]|nr:non-ribosomal peptide synthetase [Hahellaceae bacterium]|tara:strand:+ start:120465 stop:123605 length:3141 start_codon:yes stop_codon:yes gene_type:complete